MSESEVASATESDRQRPTASGRERRQHHHLRELIDEMMASLRAAANRDLFTADDRAEADKQLARIMANVRSEAMEIGDRRAMG